jgi:hypothetical protein
LSIHENPDSSNTDGIKIEANGTFVGHAFVTALSTAVGIGSTAVSNAKAAGANQVVVQALTAAVFYRLDGTAPTSAVGVEIAAGNSVALNMTDAANALFISATGGIAVTFTM